MANSSKVASAKRTSVLLLLRLGNERSADFREPHTDVFSPSLDKPQPEAGRARPAGVCDARTRDSQRYQVSREHTDLPVEDQRGISHPE